MITDLKRIIDQVSRDKGIDRAILISTLEEAIKSAAKKKFGLADNFEVAFNEEIGEMEVFRFKEVVEDVEEPQLEISLEEARILDPESQLGDELGVKIDTAEFGRIAAQSAKQVIIQRMKDAERDIVYDDFKDRMGEIINGIVQRFDKGNIIVNLGRTEALLPSGEQIPKENYRRGDRIRALIIDVKQISRGPQIILSRTHPNFLTALFETEVPEIAEGIVKIIAVAREPGSRSKIAVISEDPDIDPVGACVGMRGSRVQSVVQELRGEKIDIIPHNPDMARFIVSALAPAVVSRVIMEESRKTMEVIVSDDQLSLAIGRKGQNVRLASKLSGWKIDVKSETKYDRSLKSEYQNLLQIPDITEQMADLLYEAGYRSLTDVLAANPLELEKIEGLTPEMVDQIIDSAALHAAQLESARSADSQDNEPPDFEELEEPIEPEYPVEEAYVREELSTRADLEGLFQKSPDVLDDDDEDDEDDTTSPDPGDDDETDTDDEAVEEDDE